MTDNKEQNEFEAYTNADLSVFYRTLDRAYTELWNERRHLIEQLEQNERERLDTYRIVTAIVEEADRRDVSLIG